MKHFLFFLMLSISLSAYSQKSIPNISLIDFEGEKTKIFEAIDENQITVISLWATWCVPCIKELDAINEVYEDWKDELDFNLLAISVDDSRSVRRAKALVNGKSWPYEIYLDTNQDFKRALGTSYIPQTFIIKNKEIVSTSRGYFIPIFLIFILRTFLFEPYQIPSGSMEPHLKKCDLLLSVALLSSSSLKFPI